MKWELGILFAVLSCVVLKRTFLLTKALSHHIVLVLFAQTVLWKINRTVTQTCFTGRLVNWCLDPFPCATKIAVLDYLYYKVMTPVKLTKKLNRAVCWTLSSSTCPIWDVSASVGCLWVKAASRRCGFSSWAQTKDPAQEDDTDPLWTQCVFLLSFHLPWSTCSSFQLQGHEQGLFSPVGLVSLGRRFDWDSSLWVMCLGRKCACYCAVGPSYCKGQVLNLSLVSAFPLGCV